MLNRRGDSPESILVRENVLQLDSQPAQDRLEFIERDVMFTALDPVKRGV